MLTAKLAVPVATHSYMQGESAGEAAGEAGEGAGEASFDYSFVEVAGKSPLAEMSMICWGFPVTADQHAAGRLSCEANIDIDKLVSPGIYHAKIDVCTIPRSITMNMIFFEDIPVMEAEPAAVG
jgi:hypothetical protein